MPKRSEQLITRHRPTTFDEVVGNRRLVESLAAALKRPSRPHGFLFTGPSGIGKTSLARIVAREIHAHVEEIDAATYSGVSFTRDIVMMSQFTPITAEPNRLYIIDEAHALSKIAWNPFLKLIEDSPDNNYLAFCSTDIASIPETIRTRCFPVALRPLTLAELRPYIADIAQRETWVVQQDVLTAIALAAKGSPRRGLNILEAAHNAQSVEKLAELIPCELRPRQTVARVDRAQVERSAKLLAILRYLKEKER